MAKLEISVSAHSQDEVSSILADYTPSSLVQMRQLFGGYSGSNYRVDADDGTVRVLKVANGYSLDEAELMCRTAAELGRRGYADCCLPIPRRDVEMNNGPVEGDDASNPTPPRRYASARERNGTPAFLLTHVDGLQADRVMREHPHLAPTVLRGIGGGLARMHRAASGLTDDDARRLGLRWYRRDGGCCDVSDQMDGKVLEKIESCQDQRVRNHEFVAFYERELAVLRREMRLATEGALTMGITHGDPFADNVLVHEATGGLAGFIDIEDFCVGPLLFDLACCAIGCCFREGEDSGSQKEDKNKQVLDLSLLETLLSGYFTDRALPPLEQEHFLPFMRLTLLCNCCWRFVNFNVKSHKESVPTEARESYLELQHRIEHLYDPVVAERIHNLVQKCSNCKA